MAEETVTITGLNKLFSKIDKLAQWSIRDSENLLDIGHRVGDVYANYLKANIKNNTFEKSILRGKRKRRGQLKRSAGTWLPDKNRNTVLAGPRTNNLGRRKTTKSSDGFYAGVVESGGFNSRFGGQHNTQNTGVFTRGKKSTQSRSAVLYAKLLKENFKRFTKRL